VGTEPATPQAWLVHRRFSGQEGDKSSGEWEPLTTLEINDVETLQNHAEAMLVGRNSQPDEARTILY
jgi:hypothetical protein